MLLHTNLPQQKINRDLAADRRAIRLAERRARAELRLLTNIAPAARWGMAIVRDLGITEKHFDQDDTRALFVALEVGAQHHGTWAGIVRRAELCRAALGHLGLWDPTDTRAELGPMRWSPEKLARLFFAVDFDEGRLALRAAELIEAVEAQNQTRP
ncbi:hypothetical protein [Fontivita pretiosa]|uniref:hypothetical protein n=1 Tax=Fontivita pretiosa TaxID=2989684 RepID=UPI003D182613